MPRPGPLWLNIATVGERCGLAECVEGCARHGILAIAPWRDALADVGGAQRAARRMCEAGLTVSSLCRGGMFTAADKPGRRAAANDTRRAIGEAHALGAACLIVVSGGLPPARRTWRVRGRWSGTGWRRSWARRPAGVTLALEPPHPLACADRSVLCTQAQVLDLCDGLGADVGVVVDAYHVWWDLAHAHGWPGAGLQYAG